MADDADNSVEETVRALLEKVGGFGADDPRVIRLLQHFPIPTFDDFPALLGALQRIEQAVPWLSNALGQPDLGKVLARIAERTATSLPPVDRRSAWLRFKGDFALAGALVGSEPNPMLGAENLRAALWLCQQYWNGSHAGAVTTITQALRGAIKDRTESQVPHQVATHFARLAGARTLPEFIAAAEALLTCGLRGVEDEWPKFDRALRDIAAGIPETSPEPLPLGGPPSPPKKGKKKPKPEFDEDDVLDGLVSGLQPTPSPPRDRLPPLERGEPRGEVHATTHVVPLPPHAGNPDAKRLAQYQARQVVWGTNHLLLTTHPDVLPPPEFGEVLRALVEELKSPEVVGNLRVGCVALLLQGLLGRTAKTLRGIRPVQEFASGKPESGCELHLALGVFRVGVFWAYHTPPEESGFFRPTNEQSEWLEAVAEAFSLPLAPSFSDVLRACTEEIVALRTTEVGVIEAGMRHAARRVGDRIGLRFSAGHVRRSFAAHLFEATRDTALVQLTAADTLGQSTNPLHYYAPTCGTLAEAYWEFTNTLADSSERMPDSFRVDTRTGSALLVRDDVVATLVQAPGLAFRDGTQRMLEERGVAAVHATMVNHLACMFLVLAGHRPSDSLFALSLRDLHLDPDAGGGLFRDKVHDPAHDPRLVALAPTLVRQVRAYLAHLQVLAIHEPGLASHVHRILEGKAPLLFRIGREGKARELTIEAWRRKLPEDWTRLPLHWGRTWMRTRGVEQGLRPELASMQLGHLEAVGYPFSNAGPTEPQEFLAEVAPLLERLARRQGWVVRRGLATSDKDPEISLPPLHSWAAAIHAHQESIRDAAQAWRTQVKSRIRSYRKRAYEQALEHPVLRSSGITAAYLAKKGPCPPHSLTRLELEAVRDQAFGMAGDDDAAALANANAVVRVIRRANRRMGIVGRDPSPLMELRRPLDNAFVPGMMEAVRQVEALRETIRKRGHDKPGDWKDADLAFARVAQALALFGGIEDPAQIEGVLSHRGKHHVFATIEDAVLVRWGPGPAQVLCLRGAAALAYLFLAWKHSKAKVPERDALNARMLGLMPDWALPAKGKAARPTTDVLALLGETVGVANRLEMSPAARFALDTKRGSMSAHPREQVALLDDDPVGTVQRDWEATEEIEEPTAPLPRASKGSARWQYKQLCKLIPKVGVPLFLPLTGEAIPANDLFNAATRPKVIAEVDAMLAEKDPGKALQPIVRLLAWWVRDMYVHGTALTPNPADKSVSTHLTRIGGTLVAIFGNSSLADVGEAELEDAYIAAIEVAIDSKEKAASAVLAFDECCRQSVDLPEVDLTEVRAHLSKEARQVDSRLIIASERNHALEDLTTQAVTGVAESRRVGRIARQAAAAMPFYAYGGARRNEILGVRFPDLSLRGGSPWARIRANRARRLKTKASRRVIHLRMDPSGASTQHFTQWLATDSSRVPAWRRHRAYVFTATDQARAPVSRDAIAASCRRALASATGRRRERLHRLRHLVAFERVTPMFLSSLDIMRMDARFAPIEVASRPKGVVLPRDLMVPAVDMGHAHWRTTLTSYHHLPWMLRSRRDARIDERYLRRGTVAAVTGRTLKAVDRDRAQYSHLPESQAWFAAAAEPRSKPDPVPRSERSSITGEASSWSAVELSRVLALARRVGGLDKAMHVSGATSGEARRVLACLVPYEHRLGRRLSGGPPDAGLERPRRAIRWMAEAAPLEKILEWYDNDVAFRRKLIAGLSSSLFAWMGPKQHDWLKAPDADLDNLQALLVDAGIASSLFVRGMPLDGIGLLRLKRRLPKPSEGAADPKAEAQVDTLGYCLKATLGIVWAVESLNSGIGKPRGQA
jgi:integrase